MLRECHASKKKKKLLRKEKPLTKCRTSKIKKDGNIYDRKISCCQCVMRQIVNFI